MTDYLTVTRKGKRYTMQFTVKGEIHEHVDAILREYGRFGLDEVMRGMPDGSQYPLRQFPRKGQA